MYRATFVLDLFHGDADREISNEAMNHMLMALVAIDKDYLRKFPNTPLIYESGVRYVEEPPGQDDWQDIPTTLDAGNGDCEDLACWRCAELQVRFGIHAMPFYHWREGTDGSLTFHIQVQYPNGKIEDPSCILGMDHCEAAMRAPLTSGRLVG